MKWLILLALCGVAFGRHISKQIVNGRAASITSHPHQGSMRNYGSHFCGCSLIGPYWCLTAAHCIQNSDAFSTTVKFGSAIRSYGGQEYQVAAIYSYPYFDAMTLSNDIALVQFGSPVQEDSQTVRRISMGSATAGQICIISGWGRNDRWSDDLPEQLQELDVRLISNDECATYWARPGIGPGQVCMWDANNADGSACQGDSGGPLVCNGVLVGATSFGTQDCTTGSPAVYTRISTYRSWVSQITGI